MPTFTYEGVRFDGPAYTPESIEATKNFESRQDDLFISTYARSGTHWVQNILIGLTYGLDTLGNTEEFEMSKLSPYLEAAFGDKNGCELANQISRKPRLLKTHQPTSLAPREVFSLKRRNVLVLRNPKAVLLSYHEFYHNNMWLRDQASETLSDFLDRSMIGEVLGGSWWAWTKSWVDYCRANPETNLMIHYEDLKQDFTKEIRRLESFLNLDPMTSEAIDKLKALTSVESMKERLDTEKNYKGMGVVNKGEANRWKKEFPPEYVEKFDALTRETFGDDEIVAKFI